MNISAMFMPDEHCINSNLKTYLYVQCGLQYIMSSSGEEENLN